MIGRPDSGRPDSGRPDSGRPFFCFKRMWSLGATSDLCVSEDINFVIKASFFTVHHYDLWKRQIPNGQNHFDGVEFFVPPEDADIIFIFDDLKPGHRIKLKRQIPKIWILGEPPGTIRMGRYPIRYLLQFDYTLCHTRETPHPNLILGQTGLPWFVGCVNGSDPDCFRPLGQTTLSFNDFETHHPQKTKLVSVVASNSALLPGHRARLEFVAKLKDALGDQVDVFGRGINGFVDKRDVLDDYRYHIAIENSVVEHYWTEKLADPYLTLTFPIYHGCPNIADYFHHDAIRTINIYEPNRAIETIKDIIASDLAEKNRDALLEARRQVLYDYNIFAVMARTAKDILAQNRPVIEIKEIRSAEHSRLLRKKIARYPLRLQGIVYASLEKYPRLLGLYRFLKYKILLRKPLPTVGRDRIAERVEYLRRKSG